MDFLARDGEDLVAPFERVGDVAEIEQALAGPCREGGGGFESLFVLRDGEAFGAFQFAIGGAARYTKMMLKAKDVTVAPLGRDARKGPLITAAAKRAGSVCPPVATGHSTPGATRPGSTATAVYFSARVSHVGSGRLPSMPRKQ